MDVMDIGSRLELFVDEALIHELTGVELRLHQPVPREIALTHDALWEGDSCGSYRVFQDGELYRMYYRGLEQPLAGDAEAHVPVTCYAHSADGMHWHKPDLGLVEFAGSRHNNIVYAGPHNDTFVPFKDEDSADDDDSRHGAVCGDARHATSDGGGHTQPHGRGAGAYKSVGSGARGEDRQALFAYQSADGLRWAPLAEGPSPVRNLLKMQNLVFRDTYRGEYRAYWRAFRDLATGGIVDTRDPEHPACIRDTVTATSADLLHWTDPVFLDYQGGEDQHMYTSQVIPYYRAPHIFLGFPVRYVDRGWSDSMRALPGLAAREQRAQRKQREGTALTEGLFMCSRDGRRFKRWEEAFLRPGLRTANNWVYGDNYQAWGILTTPATLEDAPDELSIFASEAYRRPGGSRLRRFSLRVDGFVSVNAPGAGGEMTTRPLVFSGDRLVLNFSTSAAGSVRVEIQDAEGRPQAGFGIDDSMDLFGDDLERVVRWQGGADVRRLAGQVVRLHFVMRDADLYSLRFRGATSLRAGVSD